MCKVFRLPFKVSCRISVRVTPSAVSWGSLCVGLTKAAAIMQHNEGGSPDGGGGCVQGLALLAFR